MKANAPKNETQLAYHKRRMQELKNLRVPWEKLWCDLAEYVEPSRLRLYNPEYPLRRDKIIDNTGTLAWRTLASGMHSGITSPARPWFRLQISSDPEMREYAPVRIYLAECERILREVFQRSNVYPEFHRGYGDLGLFGQSVGLLVEDDETAIRLQHIPHGRFWIARDEKGRATTLYREFKWSVQRIVSRFGLDRVSTHVRRDWENGKYDETYVICHAVEPRLNRKPGVDAKWNMPFLSNYWEENGDSGDLLEESGFEENPIIAPAWEISSDDHYAVSPGHVALGDIKMLQVEQKRKLEAIDKIVRPPMTGPTSMQNNPASLLPGSITYVDDPAGKGFRPAMEVNIRLAELAQDIRETQDRISRSFYADLFLMLSNLEGIQPRNELELSQRNEEKLLQLGPVLENIYGGQLEPVIDRTFAILNRLGVLPPPPPELEGQDLQIEYISMLAQAQKAVATGGIERIWAFAGQIAAMKPDVLDKLDSDQTLDVYSEMLGVDPSIVVPDDKVAEMRQARAQQLQAQQAAEMAGQVAPAIKSSAEAASVLADAQNNPSGTDLLSRIGLA